MAPKHRRHVNAHLISLQRCSQSPHLPSGGGMHLSSAAPASSSSTAHRSLLSNHRGLCIVDFRTSICRIRCFAPRRAPGRGRRQGPALWSVTCRFGAADAQADAVLEPAKETQRLLQPHGCRPAAPMSTDTAISAKKVLPRHMIHLRQKHLAPRARMVYSASPRKLHCHLPIRLSASFCKRWGGGGVIQSFPNQRDADAYTKPKCIGRLGAIAELSHISTRL